MSEIAKKCLSFVSSHKKKFISIATLGGLYGGLKYARKTQRFEQAIGKLEEKARVQIEKEFKERAEILRKNANYEDIFTYFLGLDKPIKSILKKDIASLFKTEEISNALKDKSLTAQQKVALWSDLRDEIITQAIFSLVYIPIARTIFFIRECIINGQENSLKEKNKGEYDSLEGFLTQLSELVIIDGGKLLYNYLKEEIKPLIADFQVLGKYKKEQIIERIDLIKEKILEVELDVDKMRKLKHQDEEEGRIAVKKMLVDRRKEKKKGNKKHNQYKNSLPFPKFQVNILERFAVIVRDMRVTDDKAKFDEYCRELELSDQRIRLLLNQERMEKEIMTIEEEKDREDEGDENDLIVITGEKMEETKVNNEEPTNHKTGFEIVQESGNEFMDLLESQNLALLSLYTIGHEFEKLKNRIYQFFQVKTIYNEEIALAKFLPSLQKIMQEEFINEDADDTREKLYNSRIKTGLGILKEKETSLEEIEITKRVLTETEMKKELDLAFKEFGKRVYLGKDYEKATEKKDANGEGSGLEMFLNGISGTNLAGAMNVE